MKFEYYSKKKLDQEIKDIVRSHLDLDKYDLFYFGSRVLGKGNERSDIDIGITGPKKIGAKAMSEIKERIKWLPTLYSIELVDFSDVSDEFKNVAMQKIEKIT